MDSTTADSKPSTHTQRMAAAVKTLLLLAVMMAALTVTATTTTASDDDAEWLARYPGRRRRRNRHGGRTTPTPTPTPNRPLPAPATPVPAPGRGGRAPSTPTPPPGILLPCDRPDVPPMLRVTANGTTTPDCIPSTPTPPSSPRTTPPQPRFRWPGWPPAPLCTCPKPPGFGFGVPAPGGGGRGGAGGASPIGVSDCVPPLAPLMTCGPFVTGGADDTPTPQSECCVALAAFMNSSNAAAAAGAGDGWLRCLCPVIVGEVNRNMPRPVDPVRLMYLPIACGVVLPPETLFMCFTGHNSPRKVAKFSQLWELHG